MRSVNNSYMRRFRPIVPARGVFKIVSTGRVLIRGACLKFPYEKFCF